MIGYAFHSVGFGWGDLLLFLFSILAAVEAIRTSKHGGQSRAAKLFRSILSIIAVVPFAMLGLSFLAARLNAPASLLTQSNTNSQKAAMNLGSSINTELRESEPSFTADGRTMYFNCRDADICVSQLVGTWEEGTWTQPERLGPPISTGYFEVEPLINGAGDKLYFQSNRPSGHLNANLLLSPFVTSSFFLPNYLAETQLGVSLLDGFGMGDVWVSYKVNGLWSEPRNLKEVPGEPPVNTAFHDHCLSFSADGNEAFWTSTRPGGFGGNDIWTSHRVDGKWTAAENLGANVNGAGDEHHSIPTSDGKSLYITSIRNEGYGGEDSYVTTRDTKRQWGRLVNLGPLVNGPGDDRCLARTPDNHVFLFDSTRGGGRGSIDIWWIYSSEIRTNPPVVASMDTLLLPVFK
jgi:hypothetical protein